MGAEHGKERAKALAQLADHGWSVVKVSPKTGYTQLHCGCGRHSAWLPKTPSNRSTYRRKAAHLIAKCSV